MFFPWSRNHPCSALVLAASSLLAAAGLPASARGQVIYPVAGFPGVNGDYGRAVAVNGNWAFAAHRNDTGSGFPAGAVDLYLRTSGTWAPAGIIDGGSSLFNDFGSAVASHGNWLVIWQRHTKPGGVSQLHVYEPGGGTWQHESTISLPVDITSGSALGFPHDLADRILDVENDVFAVGLIDLNGSPDTAQVNVYRRNLAMGTWEEDSISGPPNEDFGWSVDLDGNWLAIGAPRNQAPNQGRAYLYEYDGLAWQFRQQIDPVPPMPGSVSLFGWDVALEDGRLFVGAPGYWTGAGVPSGAVYEYTLDGLGVPSAPSILIPLPLGGDGAWGRSVEVRGATLVAGGLDTYWFYSTVDFPATGVSGSYYPSLAEGVEVALSDGEPMRVLIGLVEFDEIAFYNVEWAMFSRGDTNVDGQLNLVDVVVMLDYMFGGSPAACLDAMDADDSGSITITDAFFTLLAIFGLGPGQPPLSLTPPFLACGQDFSIDALDCTGLVTCP